jgi:uncharacterized protein YndB with AHSA1/START domain
VATISTLPPQAAFHHAVLRHLAQHPEGDRRRNIHEAMPDLMGLSEAQRTERLANLPHLRYRHRSGWGLSNAQGSWLRGQSHAFFGTYVEVKPYSRLAWTNEEGGEGGPVSTVTFEEKGGKTLVVLRESYPSKEALDAAGTGAADAMVEAFDQLDEPLIALGEGSGQ